MQKLLLGLAALALLAAPAAGQRGRTAPTADPPASLRAIADEVSQERLRATVARLVSFGTRHTLSARDHPTRGIGAALNWTESEFRRFRRDCSGRSSLGSRTSREARNETTTRSPSPTQRSSSTRYCSR